MIRNVRSVGILIFIRVVRFRLLCSRQRLIIIGYQVKLRKNCTFEGIIPRNLLAPIEIQNIIHI